MKVGGALACALVIGGCGFLAVAVPSPKPSPKAAQLLAEGGYVEAYVMRRFADGRLLVRLQEGGGVWFLDPKVNCSWCWTYVDKTVWVKLDKRSATLLNPQGETAQFWNGGPVDKY
ncbi:MAG: hypothetical protein VX293_02190 [Candidatus Latescibacterota bacterium]|nr:hypothetical protein [Candidatus Latescibacterota bacterium]